MFQRITFGLLFLAVSLSMPRHNLQAKGKLAAQIDRLASPYVENNIVVGMTIGVVLLTNTATGEVYQLAEKIVQMLAGMPVEPPTFEKPVDVHPDILERYVGIFQLVAGADFTVATKDGKLFVGLTGQPTFEVYPRSETQWYYKVVKATLTFEVDDKGKCNTVELFQNGVRQKAKRIKYP